MIKAKSIFTTSVLSIVLICQLFLGLPEINAQTENGTVFFDDFNDGNADSWVTSDVGTWYVENGEYVADMGVGSNLLGYAENGDELWTDYIFEVDIKGEVGVDKLIRFRYSGEGFYSLNLRSSPYNDLVLTRDDSRGQATVNATSYVNSTGVWYHLKVIIEGFEISVYIDDFLVLNYSDFGSLVTQGKIQLVGYTGGWGSDKVRFDNVMISSSSSAPSPFLDLPWDYWIKDGETQTFEQAALNPNSWFDHKYPLQDMPCCDGPVTIYTGDLKNDAYQHHNGYDYGQEQGILLGTPVLAAAHGFATFTPASESGGAGNVIKIDHRNGYQTWYEHLSSEDLIIDVSGVEVEVFQHQQIGKVGMTGKTNGPHIHFSVFYDQNLDGSFDDEFPYGVTDPFGWEGDNLDPWPTDKGGALSYNLFSARAKPISTLISTSGGILSGENIAVNVPIGASIDWFTLTLKYGPFEAASNLLKSIVPSFFLDAENLLGQEINQLLKPVNVYYDYSQADLININENTLKLYSFNEDTGIWDEIPSFLDTTQKIISAEIIHFSQFAIMGEILDSTPPVTEIDVSGDKGQDNWYKSDVTVELIGADNEGGIGLQYSLYSLNDNDWFEYKEPLVFTSEGYHQIWYQSFDQAGNMEERHTFGLNVDKTPPETKIMVSQVTYDLEVMGIDSNPVTIERFENSNTNRLDDAIIIISDLAGNTVELDVRDRDKEMKDKFTLYSIKYNDTLPFVQPSNSFNASYEDKKERQDLREQSFAINGEIRIRIKYDYKLNQSTIIIREFGQETVKEVVNGQVLLQLVTNQGNLLYSY